MIIRRRLTSFVCSTALVIGTAILAAPTASAQSLEGRTIEIAVQTAGTGDASGMVCTYEARVRVQQDRIRYEAWRTTCNGRATTTDIALIFPLNASMQVQHRCASDFGQRTVRCEAMCSRAPWSSRRACANPMS